MGPRVDLDILRRAAERFAQLSTDGERFKGYIREQHEFTVGPGLAGLVLSNHNDVQGSVQSASYSVIRMYEEFSENFENSYQAYLRGELANIEATRRVWSELPAGSQTMPYHYPPGTVATGDLGSALPSETLVAPAPLDTSIVVMDVINAIVNQEAVLGARSEMFKWIFRIATGHDFDQVLEECFRAVIGDWEAVGLVAGLYDVYADYYGVAGTTERDASAMVFLFWSGSSAEVARAQCQEFGGRLFLNQSSLNDVSMRTTAAALGIYGLLSDLKNLLDDLMSSSAEVDSYIHVNLSLPVPVLIGHVLGAVVSILEMLFKVAELIVVLVRIVKALVEVIAIVQAAFVRFTDHLPSEL